MAKYQHPTHIADWLRANGINVNHIPVDSDLTITTDEQGRRTVHYEELITNDDDRVISFGGETRTVRRSAPLTVDPPDWWQPHEKPTREQLAAAVERVRALHVRNANTGDCEHCSERDYPDYAVPHPCPTIRALDGERQPDGVLSFDRHLTEQEVNEFKTRWNREHGGGRQNHAGPITTGPSAEEQLARFHEGEEPYVHEHTEATPGQWIWQWNRATPEERLDMAARIRDAFARSSTCIMGNHAAQQARLSQLAEDLWFEREQREDLRRRLKDTSDAYGRVDERRAALAAILHDVLRHFTQKGHPGEPCLQTGWIAEKTVARWRAVLYPPATKEQPVPASPPRDCLFARNGAPPCPTSDRCATCDAP